MTKPNNRFYFYFGEDPGYPYQGGFTVVYAEDLQLAVRGFQIFHPNRKGCVNPNCLYIFSESEWITHVREKDPYRPCREKIFVRVCREAMDNTGNYFMEGIGYHREIVEDG